MNNIDKYLENYKLRKAKCSYDWSVITMDFGCQRLWLSKNFDFQDSDSRKNWKKGLVVRYEKIKFNQKQRD